MASASAEEVAWCRVSSELIAWRAPIAFVDGGNVEYSLHWSASAFLSIAGDCCAFFCQGSRSKQFMLESSLAMIDYDVCHETF